MVGPPTINVYIVNEFVRGQDDISSLRLFIAGGAPVPSEIIKRFEAISGGGRVAHAYGATEVLCYVSADPVFGERRIAAAGMAIGSARISIIDDNRVELKAGETGEIFIQGDTVGSGYWGDPEMTAKAFADGGWLSGDIGRLDEDGYLYIVDRKKDLIISGGFNIYPIEVENLLYTHPAVKMCAVIGVPDAEKGEIPVALLTRSESGSDVDASAIISFCRENLSAYKVPRRVHFVEALPLSPVGKILKREIRRQLESGELPI
jgi:long-chain acyl-CoA synthetase